MNVVLLYVAAGLTAIWGVSHLFPTRGVVRGFGELSADNRRIITMEWITEGIALISVAAFVIVATAVGHETAVASGVYAVAIATLLTMAVVSVFTGFKVAFLPFRLCPVIFSVSALLIGLGAWL